MVADVAGPAAPDLRCAAVTPSLEIEWHGPTAGPGPDSAQTPAGAPGAGRAGAGVTGAVATTPAPPAAEPLTAHGPHPVVSPMVGTFYRAPEPGAAPFVAVGDLVGPGQVVGIVEAMKLMNEITAGQAGRVVEVLVGDGQPVEYDQPLIALAPAVTNGDGVPMFEKVLIANRGEIALRVAARLPGTGHPHRRRPLHRRPRLGGRSGWPTRPSRSGRRPAGSSYLNAAAIVEAARQTGAQAVHPGYGFLSEDADFAEICADNGLTFIGPGAEVDGGARRQVRGAGR